MNIFRKSTPETEARQQLTEAKMKLLEWESEVENRLFAVEQAVAATEMQQSRIARLEQFLGIDAVNQFNDAMERTYAPTHAEAFGTVPVEPAGQSGLFSGEPLFPKA